MGTQALTASAAPGAADPAPARTAYVGEIDALRCFAMTAVVLQHCQLLPLGWMGVWLFYVISGFAITTSLLGSDAPHPSRGLLIRNFMLRRAIRIWPIYVLFVAGNMIWALIASRPDILGELPYLLTFTYNFRMIAHEAQWPAIGHLWTISVEEQFYLVFPFLFAFLDREGLKRALAALVVAGPLIRAGLSVWAEGALPDDGYKAFAIYVIGPAHFDSFAIGALIALHRDAIAADLARARLYFFAALGAFVAYCGVYAGLQMQSLGFGADALRNIISGILWGEGRQIVMYSAIALLAGSLIALVLAKEAWIGAVCAIPGLQAIGRVSYGAYLYHLPVLVLVSSLLPARDGAWSFTHQAMTFAIVYGVTLAVAFASFRFIEKPFLRLRHRFA
ncbi:MAG: acyltransferase [Hyphomonadaceae bacterium]|nr:acyltransferase [Hyphomonadaceae bacterium]